MPFQLLKFQTLTAYLALLMLGPSIFPKKENLFFTEKVLPLLEEYCFDCHGEGAKKGDFAMDELISLGNFEKHSKKWMCLENLYNRNMPPANVPQPFDQKVTVLSWIEKAY